MERNRLFIILGLVLVIIIMVVVLFVKKESVFAQKIEVRYPDGCVEVFRNGVPITPLCTNGRILREKEQTVPQVPGAPIINFTQGWSK